MKCRACEYGTPEPGRVLCDSCLDRMERADARQLAEDLEDNAPYVCECESPSLTEYGMCLTCKRAPLTALWVKT